MGKNKKSPFYIEMDIKTGLFFVILLLLTGLIVFYLGVLFGEAQRDPSMIVKENTQRLFQGKTKKELQIPKKLGIYKLGQKKEGVSGNFNRLNIAVKQATDKADKIGSEMQKSATDQAENISDLKQALEQEKNHINKVNQTKTQEKSKEKLVKMTVEQTSRKPKKNWLTSDKTTKNAAKYTLQILATSNKSKANQLVKSLKQKGFNAYIEEVKLVNKMRLYRILIGKSSYQSIVNIKAKVAPILQGMRISNLTIRLAE